MARRAVKRAAAAIAAWAALAASAADPRWYLQVDNDVFYGTDRWYTSGVRIAGLLPRGDHTLELGLLQEIYTPEAKRHNDIDRPNEARLLASFARHDRTPRDWNTIEVDLGVAGPSALGRQAQELVHRVVPAPKEDWSHERTDRVDASLVWSRMRTLDDPRDGAPYFNGHYGVVLGNQLAFAHAGVELRFGHGEASRALETPALRFAATPPFGDPDHGSWTTFLGASVRAVAWNHLLDFAPGLDMQTPKLRHVVQRYVGGIAWTGRSTQVTFTLVHDTREFEGQRRDAGFGSVTLHVAF